MMETLLPMMDAIFANSNAILIVKYVMKVFVKNVIMVTI